MTWRNNVDIACDSQIARKTQRDWSFVKDSIAQQCRRVVSSRTRVNRDFKRLHKRVPGPLGFCAFSKHVFHARLERFSVFTQTLSLVYTDLNSERTRIENVEPPHYEIPRFTRWTKPETNPAWNQSFSLNIRGENNVPRTRL